MFSGKNDWYLFESEEDPNWSSSCRTDVILIWQILSQIVEQLPTDRIPVLREVDTGNKSGQCTLDMKVMMERHICQYITESLMRNLVRSNQICYEEMESLATTYGKMVASSVFRSACLAIDSFSSFSVSNTINNY
ncbi:hypothetical protein JCM33374_g3583 [Metschnikowia sp. JCM 33374]|nr:hypothetical protein JCM33374_g3583 [Metschnikowia sp. JCM 33374]